MHGGRGYANPRVTMVDLHSQYRRLQPRIDAALGGVLENGRFILGPEVAALETALEAFTGAAHAVCVGNGTDALRIALAAERVGAGDAVFLPSFTFAGTAEAAIQVGATPVFVDIDEATFTIDPAHLADMIGILLARGELRPRAVIAVDLFGLPADYRALQRIATRSGLFLLADAAQSFGARHEGRGVGTLAAATATSFYPSKPLGAYGDGGCLFTDDATRAQGYRSLRNHGVEGDVAVRVGANSRLDTLQAAVLLAKLEILEEELAARARVAGWYDVMLPDAVRRPARPRGRVSSWCHYSVLSSGRDALMRVLADDGIESRVYYATPLHLQPPYGAYGDGPGSLPVTERVSRQVLSLPLHPYLDGDAVERVCRSVATVCTD